MGLFRYINRYQQMDRLIKLQSTGTPQEFAEKLHISESHLYFSLKELKDMGLPIEYDRRKQSYLYRDKVKLDIQIAIEYMTTEERILLSGGKIMEQVPQFFYPLFYNQSKLV